MASVLDEELHHFGGLFAAPLKDGDCAWFADHARAQDAEVMMTASKNYGEFCTIVGRYSKNGNISEETISRIHRATAIGPIGIVAQEHPSAFIEALAATRSWSAFSKRFVGRVLSESDFGVLIKAPGTLIRGPECIAPCFGWTALEQVAPERAKGLRDLIDQYGGTEGPRRALDLVPRDLMKAARDQALKHAQLAWQLAQMRKDAA